MPVPRGLVGVIHLPPLPGDPAPAREPFLEAVRRDARALQEGGVDALLVENLGSAPFARGTADDPAPPAHVAALALAAAEAGRTGLPVGVNVLRNDARAALDVAAVTGAAFVRINVHTGAAVTDQGLLQGEAFHTLRRRAALGIPHVAILADVSVKHAAPLAPRPLGEEVGDLVHRGRADAVLVTGPATGQPVDAAFLEAVRHHAGETPVLVASGLSPERAPQLCPHADGAIVGTWLKRDGVLTAPVDPDRVRALVQATAGRWRR